MKLLITGLGGMLATDLIRFVKTDYELKATSIFELDITDAKRVMAKLEWEKPEIIINTAAFTGVDAAETEREEAMAVNARGPENLAKAAKKIGAKLVHISTDYVFDGNTTEPYKEDAQPNPINFYGFTKLQGEKAIQENIENFIIIRTAGLYGLHGRNFPSIIFNHLITGKDVRVVKNQITSSTYTKDLSEAISLLLKTDYRGIVNITNRGYHSWYEMAEEIRKITNIKIGTIHPILDTEWQSPAKRPRFSALSCDLFEKLTKTQMRPWQEALKAFLGVLK